MTFINNTRYQCIISPAITCKEEKKIAGTSINIETITNTATKINRYGGMFQGINLGSSPTRAGNINRISQNANNNDNKTKPNTYNPLNKNGNTFQGIFANSTFTKPGNVNRISQNANNNDNKTKSNTYNPLNKHGNTFQGIFVNSTSAKPGNVNRISQNANNNDNKTKSNTYNPLNKHGNTFQGIFANSTLTKPGTISRISQNANNNDNETKLNTYNPLNKHGNTFQGFISKNSFTSDNTDGFQEDNDIYVVGDDSSKIEKWAFSDSTVESGSKDIRQDASVNIEQRVEALEKTDPEKLKLNPYNYQIAFITTEKNEFEYKDEYSDN
ncbi:MAG: hypothetical protein ACH344_03715 [Yersinia sp. (in: enterobacteria)]